MDFIDLVSKTKKASRFLERLSNTGLPLLGSNQGPSD